MGKPVHKVTAKDIEALLANRHSKDVSAAECPIDASGSTGYGRMDFWAMKRAWARPMVYGYEIKVSRSDFLKDDKWPAYLPFCNQFYFVVAHGVCDPREIPENCGMILVAKTGTRLFTKKKAPTREVDDADLSQVYKSLLINRATLSKNKWTGHEKTREERMEEWRVDLDDRQRLGWRVGGAIKKMLSDARDGQRKAEERVAKYEEFRARLIEHGIDPDDTGWRSVDKQVDRFAGRLQLLNMSRRVEQAVDALTVLKDEIESIENTKTV